MPKNTGMGSLSLFQQIFTSQELNWGLLHCRWFFTNWAIREAQTFYKTMNFYIWIRSTHATKFTGSCYVCSKATLWIINHSFEGLYVVPWRRQWQPTPVLLPGKSHGRRSLVGCSPWGRWELDTTERLHFHFSLSCIGEGNGNPLQCSCLENPRDSRAWWAAIYGVTQSRTWLKQLSSSSSSMLFLNH